MRLRQQKIQCVHCEFIAFLAQRRIAAAQPSSCKRLRSDVLAASLHLDMVPLCHGERGCGVAAVGVGGWVGGREFIGNEIPMAMLMRGDARRETIVFYR